MADDSIKSWIDSEVKGATLETRLFGRTNLSSYWIEGNSIAEVGDSLKRSKYSLDWLENLSAIQMDQAIVLTYFIRSVSTGERVILRVSVSPSSPEEVEAQSVAAVWPMASLFEREIGELFGIRFRSKGKDCYGKRFLLSEGMKGYPLRKTFHVQGKVNR